MTFGKQRNATRWKRRKNVESREFRKNAKKRVEFVRYQDDFSKLFLCKWYLYLIIDNYLDNWNKTKMQLYKFESIFNRSTKFGLQEWATAETNRETFGFGPLLITVLFLAYKKKTKTWKKKKNYLFSMQLFSAVATMFSKIFFFFFGPQKVEKITLKSCS